MRSGLTGMMIATTLVSSCASSPKDGALLAPPPAASDAPPIAAPPPASSAPMAESPPPTPPPRASSDAPRALPAECTGAALDLDKLLHTNMVCPGPENKPTPTDAAALELSTSVKKLQVKKGADGSFEVTLTNKTDAPVTLDFDASCGVPELRASVSGKKESASGQGALGSAGNCRAVLCVPRTVRVVLSPRGTARMTARVYAGDRPPFYCEGAPTPYPPGDHYRVGFSLPAATSGRPLSVDLPLAITP